MVRKKTLTRWRKNIGVAAGATIMLIAIAGCATETPRAAAPITQEQVRDHSEKAFDKLKQEENNRPAGSRVSPQ